MDSMQKLESLDIPRGVVAAANRHAASRVDIVELVKLAKGAPSPEAVMEQGRAAYKEHFDSFISGAQWCLVELGKKMGRKPTERVVSLTECDDFAHVFQGQAQTCQCGEKQR